MSAEWVESEEFDDICHNYRTWPDSDPPGVMARFEELKKYIVDRVVDEIDENVRDVIREDIS